MALRSVPGYCYKRPFATVISQPLFLRMSRTARSRPMVTSYYAVLAVLYLIGYRSASQPITSVAVVTAFSPDRCPSPLNPPRLLAASTVKSHESIYIGELAQFRYLLYVWTVMICS